MKNKNHTNLDDHNIELGIGNRHRESEKRETENHDSKKNHKSNHTNLDDHDIELGIGNRHR